MEAKVLKDRTKGLDSRGNQAMNTQAESNWATDTLKDISDNPETLTLITDELKRVYDDSKKVNGFIDKKLVGSFQKGFEDYFGQYKEDSKTKQLRMTKPPKAKAQPQDLVNLMLESKYNFKEAVDTLARVEKDTDVGKDLYKTGRGDVKEFKDRGRKDGRKRRNSFVGPHAGISDHVFRPEGSDNFFTREVVHAKGMLEGDPTSDTYNKFVEQGAPFIGGVSGTIQGVTMCWEAKQKLDDIDDDDEKEAEIERREKTVGIYMATLVAGGHHSMTEMLFASQQHGLFGNVPNPLENYPGAMKALGDRFEELGLPGNLLPDPGKTWNKALDAAKQDITKVRNEIKALFVSEDDDDDSDDDSDDDDDDDDYENDDKGILQAFDREFVRGFDALFPADLAKTLDEIVALVDVNDQDERSDKKEEAADLIKDARAALDDKKIDGLEENPFVPVSVRKALSSALDQVSSLTN